jgi:crotonobetainyl-CoA:carnitine CoA-transferase CaiB-like acyl-CoA transferase
VPRPPEEIVATLQRERVAASVSMHSRDLAEDAQLAQSGFFVHLPHREVGTRLHLGIPWRMSETPCAVRHAAPCLGEHTDEVLEHIVGYSPERVAELRARGVLG